MLYEFSTVANNDIKQINISSLQYLCFKRQCISVVKNPQIYLIPWWYGLEYADGKTFASFKMCAQK